MMLVFVIVGATSCLSSNDDDTVLVADNCYISGISISTFRVKNSSGGYTSQYGTYYTFSVDQKNLTIQNPYTPLPFGADLTKVVVSIDYTAALIEYKTPLGEQWNTYTSTDSLDLSGGMQFMVAATNGDTRIYTMTVKKYSAEADSTSWDSIPAPVGLDWEKPIKTVTLNGDVRLFTPDSVYEFADSRFTAKALKLPSAIDVSTICTGCLGDTLYASSTTGQIMSTTDGITWSTKFPTANISDVKLYAAGVRYLYGVREGGLCRIALDDMVNTKGQVISVPGDVVKDSVDEHYDYTQSGDIRCLSYLTDGDTWNMIMTTTNGETAEIWSKAWYLWAEVQNTLPETNEIWMYHPVTWDEKNSKCYLPSMKNMQLLYYYDRILAFGQGSTGFLESEDNGQTWFATGTVKMDDGVCRALNGSQLTSCVDDDNFIWVFGNGKIRRGILNKLAQ